MSPQLSAQQEAVASLLRQIGDLDPDDGTIRLVECGLHSGFPPCCVVFFVQVWWPAHMLDGSSPALRKTRALMSDYQRVLRRVRADHARVSYIPCPDCVLSKKFVMMKKCSRHFSRRQRDQIRKVLAA